MTSNYTKVEVIQSQTVCECNCIKCSIPFAVISILTDESKHEHEEPIKTIYWDQLPDYCPWCGTKLE